MSKSLYRVASLAKRFSKSSNRGGEFVQLLETRQLLTTPTFGWTLNVAGVRPVVWVNANGSSLVSSPAFNAENLNSPTGSFNTSKGTDGSGRKTFGPASGLPADGNYEFTLPASSFASGGTDVQATDFFVNGDVNHDRSVDSSDGYIIYQNSYGGGAKSFAQGDLDGDSDVDSADFAIVGSRYGVRLAPAPTYEGEVTVSSLAVQADGTTPLVVNWAKITDATVQASDPSNANKTVAGYTVYRSADSTNFTQIADVMRITTSEPSVYGYTDPTPVDGTKYWYRIRPFYAVTQPDGSSGFQHLPTTNKAWRISALRAPSAASLRVDGSTAQVSWQDNSLNESGFLIERGSGTSWVTVATASPNTTTFNFDASTLGFTDGIRIRALQFSLQFESAFSVDTDRSINSDPSNLIAVKRVTVALGNISSINYDVGIAHANESITVADAAISSPSAITPGTYTVGTNGIVILPLQNLDSRKIRSTVLVGTNTGVLQVEDPATEPTPQPSPWGPVDPNILNPAVGANVPRDSAGNIIAPALTGGLLPLPGPPLNPGDEAVIGAEAGIIFPGLVIPGSPDGSTMTITIPAGSKVRVRCRDDGSIVVIGISPPPGQIVTIVTVPPGGTDV